MTASQKFSVFLLHIRFDYKRLRNNKINKDTNQINTSFTSTEENPFFFVKEINEKIAM
jgi:hypothetical protein